MKETLSIDLDSMLVERVRRYSREHGTDVAGTISELIASLPSGAGEHGGTAPPPDASRAAEGDEVEGVRNLPPLTRSLLGAGSCDAGEEDCKEYLWRKYGS